MLEPIDTTPHKEGVSSVVEAFPGASLSIALVVLLRGTRWEMDGVQSAAFVALGSWVSSYITAFCRKRLNG